MHLLKYKSATWLKNLALFQHVGSDLFSSSVGKNMLRITATAPQTQPISKLLFQLRCIHPGRAYLNRINCIKPRINQLIQKQP